MSAPSSFEIGQAIGGNVSGAIRGAREKSTIDEILEQAHSTGNQEDVDMAMRQILTRVSPERQGAALQVLGQKNAQIQQQRRRQAYEAEGLNPSIADLDPGVQKEILKSHTQTSKKKDSNATAKNALGILARQRELLGTGHLGPKVGVLGTGRKWGSTTSAEGQAARAEYQRLGKSLIQMSSNIPIRNRQEFEVLAHDLYDPNLNQEDIVGILNAMERIIRGSIEGEEEDFVTQKAQATGQTTKAAQRPALDSFYR